MQGKLSGAVVKRTDSYHTGSAFESCTGHNKTLLVGKATGNQIIKSTFPKFRALSQASATLEIEHATQFRNGSKERAHKSCSL